jgi:hypothetical protein
MTVSDISPLFLSHIKYKVFSNYCTKVVVAKLQCIKPTKKLIKGEIYWAHEDCGQKSSWNGSELYDVYKILLPELGPRKYDPKRFKVLGELTLYKKDFNYYKNLENENPTT